MAGEENGDFTATDEERKLLERLRASKVTSDQALDLMTTGARAKSAASKPAPPAGDPPTSGSDPDGLVTQRDLAQHRAQTGEAVTAMQHKHTINDVIKAVIVEDGIYATKPKKIAALQREVAIELRGRPEIAGLDDDSFLDAVRAETTRQLKEDHDAHALTDGKKAEADAAAAKAKAAKTGERVDPEAPPKTKTPHPDEQVEGAVHVIKDDKTMKTGLSEHTRWPTSDAELKSDGHRAAKRFLREADVNAT